MKDFFINSHLIIMIVITFVFQTLIFKLNKKYGFIDNSKIFKNFSALFLICGIILPIIVIIINDIINLSNTSISIISGTILGICFGIYYITCINKSYSK